MKKNMVKRALALVLVLGMTMGIMAGCGKKQPVAEAKIDLKALEKSMEAADNELPKMKTVFASDDGAEDIFASLCDADYDLVQDYFYCYEEEGGPVEFAVIFVNDEKKVKDVVESLKEHRESRVKTFENYNPEKVELASNAMVSYNGNYVCYVMGEKANYMKAEFEKALDN